MARRPLVAGNWKMNLDHLEAIALVQRLAYSLDADDTEAAEVAVIPAFTALRSVSTLIEGDRLPLALGSQDCHCETAGAYTGAVSPLMLSKLRVDYVLCGHSERRAVFGDTDEMVNRKLTAVLAAGMTPILCVGETDEQREAGQAESVVAGQVRAGLEGVEAERVADIVIAYEPVWAIGTGKTATSDDADAMCGSVRGVVADICGGDVAERVRIQYGGSVKAGNAADLLARPHVDGALVGGASLDAEDFAVICKAAARRR